MFTTHESLALYTIHLNIYGHFRILILYYFREFLMFILFHDAYQAVNQLCSHFEAYRDVPKITELREKFKNIKQILKSHVFSDFSRYVVKILCKCWYFLFG